MKAVERGFGGVAKGWWVNEDAGSKDYGWVGRRLVYYGIGMLEIPRLLSYISFCCWSVLFLGMSGRASGFTVQRHMIE